MATSRVLRIDGEQQAFNYLAQALHGDFDNTNISLSFQNWPTVTITAEGPGYDSTITPDMAEALVELQQSMNRAYARFVYGKSDSRSLTNDEKQAIKFKAKVKSGSSVIEVNLGDFADKLTTALTAKMTGTEIIIAVLGFAVVAGSTLAYKAFLKHKSEDKKIGEETKRIVALSANETRRLEIMAEALTAQPKLVATNQDFDDTRREFLRSAVDANSLNVNSVPLDKDSAKIIASTPRTASQEIQINGNYRIFKIDWQHEDDAKLVLGGGPRSGEFSAMLGLTTLTDEQKEMLKEAEWSRRKLYMQINGTELRGTITAARVISVAWPRKNEPGA